MKNLTEEEVIEQFYNSAIIAQKKEDLKSAHMRYKLAADKGHAKAQCAVARMYRLGQGVFVDYEKAFFYYELSSRQNNPEAHFGLSMLYVMGAGVAKDVDKVTELMHKSASGGYAPAQYEIGESFYSSGSDQKLGLEYLKASADQGYVPALRRAGIVCFEDKNAEDIILARKYLELLKPADRKIADQCILGLIYYEGSGVTVDKKKAKGYFEVALSLYKSKEELVYLTIAEACVGVTFLDDACGTKDLSKAHTHFSRAINRLTIDKPIIKVLTTAILKGIHQLDFSDLCHLIRLHQHLPEKKTWVYPQTFKQLYDIYVGALRSCSSNTSQEQQDFVKNLVVLEDYPPERTYALAMQEFAKNDKQIRPEYLRDYLMVSCYHEDFGEIYTEGLYYLGIYFLINFFNDSKAQEKGLEYINSSEKKGYLSAKNHIKLSQLDKKDPERINILIEAGKDAEDKKIYQVAKFYYKEALSANASKDNLLRRAVLEGSLGEEDVATQYFSDLLKKDPEPEVLYQSLKFFSRTDMDRAVRLLDKKDTLYNQIKKEVKDTSWQENLYVERELHIARGLFSKNKMQQGLKRIEQVIGTGCVNAVLALGICYIEGWGVSRSYGTAVKYFRTIPANPLSLYYWAIISLHNEHPDTHEKMQKCFKKYSYIPLMQEYLTHCDSAAGLIYLGNKACESNYFRIASMHYQQALKREPENTEGLFRMGFCSMQWGEYETALQYINQVLQDDKAHEHAKIVQEMCHLRLGIVPAQPESVLLVQEEIAPETESYQPARLVKKTRKKRALNSEARNIASYKDSIFACTTTDQFMVVFYKITASNLYASLRGSLKTWVDEHTENKPQILHILQQQGDLYVQYIDEWNLNSVENTVIEAVKPPVVTPAIQTPVQILQIPVVIKNSTELRPNLKQKRQAKETYAHNQNLIEMYERLHWVPEYKTLLSRLHWCLNQQITNIGLHGQDISKFKEYIQQFQDMEHYRTLCNVYAFFMIEQANMHQYPIELHQHFTDIQIIMRDIHRDIEELREQCFSLYEKLFVKPVTEIQSHIKDIKQFQEAFNHFSHIRKAMNRSLKQKNARQIFEPAPLVVGDLFIKFASLCKEAYLTGSGGRKIYEQERNIFDADLDYILCDANIEKLEELGCVRIPYLTDMVVYTFKYWYSLSNWISVDLLCIPQDALLEDMRNRDLTSTLYYDDKGNFNNLSGKAFHDLDNHIIDIPGNPIERAHKEPRLLLRVVAEELRMIKQFKIPHISEAVTIAFKTLTKNPDSPDQTGRIHAFTRKCIKKFGSIDLVKKLQEHGLLDFLFDIKHESAWEMTATLLEKKVAKEFLPMRQVEPEQNSVWVSSSMFHHKKESDVSDEKKAECGFDYSK